MLSSKVTAARELIAEGKVESEWITFCAGGLVGGPHVILQGHGSEGEETVEIVELPSVKGRYGGG
jgi:hypothetical protein